MDFKFTIPNTHLITTILLLLFNKKKKTCKMYYAIQIVLRYDIARTVCLVFCFRCKVRRSFLFIILVVIDELN